MRNTIFIRFLYIGNGILQECQKALERKQRGYDAIRRCINSTVSYVFRGVFDGNEVIVL